MENLRRRIEDKSERLFKAFLFKGSQQDALRITGLKAALKIAEDIDSLQIKCKRLFENGRFDEFHIYKSDLTLIQKEYKKCLEFLSNNG